MCATAYVVSPILRLKRSPQSGNYVMTAVWQTVFSQSQLYAWLFGSGRINLSNMQAGDHIEIRVSSRQTSGGAWVLEDMMVFDDAQPTSKPKISIGTNPDTFGVMVEMRQTAGVLRNVYCEFFDATR